MSVDNRSVAERLSIRPTEYVSRTRKGGPGGPPIQKTPGAELFRHALNLSVIQKPPEGEDVNTYLKKTCGKIKDFADDDEYPRIVEKARCESGIMDPGFGASHRSNFDPDKCVTLAEPDEPLRDSDFLKLNGPDEDVAVGCFTKQTFQSYRPDLPRNKLNDDQKNNAKDLQLQVSRLFLDSVKRQPAGNVNALNHLLLALKFQKAANTSAGFEFMTLKPYQLNVICRILKAANTPGANNLIMHHPVGAGKTVTAIAMILLTNMYQRMGREFQLNGRSRKQPEGGYIMLNEAIKAFHEINDFKKFARRFLTSGEEEDEVVQAEKHVVVVCPPSVADAVWNPDLTNMSFGNFHHQPGIIYPRTQVDVNGIGERLNPDQTLGKMQVIILKDSFLKDKLTNEIIANMFKDKICLLVVDEIHRMKGPIRSRCIRALATHADRSIGLTGTAASNNLSEISTLVEMINPTKKTTIDAMSTRFQTTKRGEIVVYPHRVFDFRTIFMDEISHQAMRTEYGFDKQVRVFAYPFQTYVPSGDAESQDYSFYQNKLNASIEAQKKLATLRGKLRACLKNEEGEDDDDDDDALDDDGDAYVCEQDMKLKDFVDRNQDLLKYKPKDLEKDTVSSNSLVGNIQQFLSFLGSRGEDNVVNQKTMSILRLILQAKEGTLPTGPRPEANNTTGGGKVLVATSKRTLSYSMYDLIRMYNEQKPEDDPTIVPYFYLSTEDQKAIVKDNPPRDTQLTAWKQAATSDEIHVLFLSIDAGGEGIRAVGPELCQCSTMIFATLHWNPAMITQTIARIYRPPQRYDVNVYIPFVKNSLEEAVIKNLETKIEVISRGDPTLPFELSRTKMLENVQVQKTLQFIDATVVEMGSTRSATQVARAPARLEFPVPRLDPSNFYDINFLFDTNMEGGYVNQDTSAFGNMVQDTDLGVGGDGDAAAN